MEEAKVLPTNTGIVKPQRRRGDRGRGKKFPRRQAKGKKGVKKPVIDEKKNATVVPIEDQSQVLHRKNASVSVRQLTAMKKYSASGMDARNPLQTVPKSWKDKVEVSLSNVDVSVYTNFDCVVGAPLAALSSAYTQGYLDRIFAEGNPNYGYFSFVFMIKAIEAAIQGTQITTVQMPRWFIDLLNALRPKVVPFKAGNVNYSWVYIQNPNYPPTVAMPGLSGNSTWTAYTLSTNTVDSYELLVPPTASYTDELGAQAFKDLCTFMSGDRSGLRSPLWKMEVFTQKSRMSKSADVFALSSAILGRGLGSGSLGKVTSLEVPLLHPAFATYGIDNGASKRYFRLHRNFSGDPIVLGSLLVDAKSVKEYRTKQPPIFKYIDHGELVDVLAQWFVLLFSQYSQDVNIQVKNLVNLGMSFQDFNILVRAVAMYVFASSNHWGQSMINLVPTGNDDYFIPFLSSSSGAVSNSNVAGIQLPILFAENLKCLKSAINYAYSVPGSKTIDYSNPTYMIPVYGKWSQNVLVASDYQYLNVSTNAMIPIFTADPTDVINIVDGSTNGGYANIGGSNKLTELVQIWNENIETLRAYSMSLTTLESDEGLNAFRSIGFTRVCQVFNESKKLKREKFIKEKEKPKEFKVSEDWTLHSVRRNFLKHRISVNAVTLKEPQYTYNEVQIMSTQSQQYFNNTVWSKVLSIWILPVGHVNVTNTDVDNFNTEDARIFYSEPNIIRNAAVQNSSTTMHTTHTIYAQQLVRTKYGLPQDIETILQSAAESGKGGLIGGILEAFAPVIASAVGGMIPI